MEHVAYVIIVCLIGAVYQHVLIESMKENPKLLQLFKPFQNCQQLRLESADIKTNTTQYTQCDDAHYFVVFELTSSSSSSNNANNGCCW